MSARRRMMRALLMRDEAALRREDPQALASVLVGMVAQVVGSIPPEVWEGMSERAETPCEDPLCTCQDLAAAAWPAFEVLRRDYREQVVTRGLS